MLAFSSLSTVEVRLPAGDDPTSRVHVVGFIRDILYCVAEVNLSSVVVTPDSEQIVDLITVLQNTGGNPTTNPIVQVLSSGNQNAIGQVITSASRMLNEINEQAVETAVAGQTIDLQ